MLKELSKRDSEWRKIAFKICGNKMLADDLVNDMYLKMHKIQPKELKTHYISYAIYHLFLNRIEKDKKTLSLDSFVNFNLTEDENNTEDRQRMNEILNEIGLLDREILLHTHENSLRKVSEKINMSHVKLFRKKKIAIDRLNNTNGIKKWKNER